MKIELEIPDFIVDYFKEETSNWNLSEKEIKKLIQVYYFDQMHYVVDEDQYGPDIDRFLEELDTNPDFLYHLKK